MAFFFLPSPITKQSSDVKEHGVLCISDLFRRRSDRVQWRIQDLPLGEVRAIGSGGVPTFDVGTFQQKRMQKQKNWILLGRGGCAGGAPPGSANGMFTKVMSMSR